MSEYPVKKVCPFNVPNPDGTIYCSGEKCMAWRKERVDKFTLRNLFGPPDTYEEIIPAGCRRLERL